MSFDSPFSTKTSTESLPGSRKLRGRKTASQRGFETVSAGVQVGPRMEFVCERLLGGDCI